MIADLEEASDECTKLVFIPFPISDLNFAALSHRKKNEEVKKKCVVSCNFRLKLSHAITTVDFNRRRRSGCCSGRSQPIRRMTSFPSSAVIVEIKFLIFNSIPIACFVFGVREVWTLGAIRSVGLEHVATIISVVKLALFSSTFDFQKFKFWPDDWWTIYVETNILIFESDQRLFCLTRLKHQINLCAPIFNLKNLSADGPNVFIQTHHQNNLDRMTGRAIETNLWRKKCQN